MASRHLHVALLVCLALFKAHALVGGAASSLNMTSRGKAQAERGYTQNSLCRENNCINPLFPGLNDMPRLEALTWQCSSNQQVNDYMGFCKDAVLYDPALPSPLKAAKSVVELVKAQDDAAMTMFVYHLAGMGYDAWDYRDPSQSDNDCVRSVWKMVCYTYFPRANAGCKGGEMSLYQRPCGSSCTNYLSHCAVECCDESVQCRFSHTKTEADGKVVVLQTGYAEDDGPSATCTGAARRSISAPFFLLLAILGIQCASSSSDNAGTKAQAVQAFKRPAGRHSFMHLPLVVLFVGLCLGLQGCDSNIATHTVGNWRAKPSYLAEYKFLPPGANPRGAVLNSCSQKDISPSLQCSGRGYCEAFTQNAIIAQERDQSVLAFCRCETGYADPECSTERKSQTKAFALSVCFGMFGADYFYLGYPLWGIGKLVTLGGFGFWWLVDIVRIGSGPVYAQQFRVASDLSHWIAMLILIFLCTALGFMAAIESYLSYRKQRRDNMATLAHSEEERHYQTTKQSMMGGYGAAQTPKGGFENVYGSGGTPPMPMVQFGGGRY